MQEQEQQQQQAEPRGSSSAASSRDHVSKKTAKSKRSKDCSSSKADSSNFMFSINSGDMPSLASSSSSEAEGEDSDGGDYNNDDSDSLTPQQRQQQPHSASSASVGSRLSSLTARAASTLSATVGATVGATVSATVSDALAVVRLDTALGVAPGPQEVARATAAVFLDNWPLPQSSPSQSDDGTDAADSVAASHGLSPVLLAAVGLPASQSALARLLLAAPAAGYGTVHASLAQVPPLTVPAAGATMGEAGVATGLTAVQARQRGWTGQLWAPVAPYGGVLTRWVLEVLRLDARYLVTPTRTRRAKSVPKPVTGHGSSGAHSTEPNPDGDAGLDSANPNGSDIEDDESDDDDDPADKQIVGGGGLSLRRLAALWCGLTSELTSYARAGVPLPHAPLFPSTMLPDIAAATAMLPTHTSRAAGIAGAGAATGADSGVVAICGVADVLQLRGLTAPNTTSSAPTHHSGMTAASACATALCSPFGPAYAASTAAAAPDSPAAALSSAVSAIADAVAETRRRTRLAARTAAGSGAQTETAGGGGALETALGVAAVRAAAAGSAAKAARAMAAARTSGARGHSHGHGHAGQRQRKEGGGSDAAAMMAPVGVDAAPQKLSPSAQQPA